jgi:hypothetical protein
MTDDNLAFGKERGSDSITAYQVSAATPTTPTFTAITLVPDQDPPPVAPAREGLLMARLQWLGGWSSVSESR